MREATLIGFKFANGVKTSTAPDGTAYANVSHFAFGGFYVSSEFNGDTISFASNTPFGAVVKLEKIAATGWNFFTADELVKISSSSNISISTNINTSAEAVIYLELKS